MRPGQVTDCLESNFGERANSQPNRGKRRQVRLNRPQTILVATLHLTPLTVLREMSRQAPSDRRRACRRKKIRVHLRRPLDQLIDSRFALSSMHVLGEPNETEISYGRGRWQKHSRLFGLAPRLHRLIRLCKTLSYRRKSGLRLTATLSAVQTGRRCQPLHAKNIWQKPTRPVSKLTYE